MPAGPLATHDWAKHIALAPPGAIAEFGCFDGGSARALAQHKRPVFAFDTFAGIPTEDFNRQHGDHDEPGKFAPSAKPWELFKDAPNVYPVVGRYADTLPQHLGLRFAFAYIDCDLYESYRQVLAYVAPRMDGDAFMCDDYHACAGAKKAVDEWIAQQSVWTFDAAEQVFRRKPKLVCPHCQRGIY